MVRRTLMTTGLGLAVLGGVATAQDAASVAELQKQLADLKARLEQMEAKQGEIKTAMKETNEAVAEQNKKLEKTDARLSLGKGIDGLRLTGDLRERFEMRNVRWDNDPTAAKGGTGDRTRLRSRFRLGGVWTNKSEDWEVGAGVATGNDKAGRSTNADWGRSSSGSAFEHMELWLDYGYAKHKWLMGDTPVALTLGQQKSPFVTSLLNWDNDLRPIGGTAQYGDPMGKDYSGPFATAGMYMLNYRSDGKAYTYVDSNSNGKQDANEPTIAADPQTEWDDNVWLYWTQAGYKLKTDNWDTLAAVGLQIVPDAYRNGTIFVNSNMPNNPIGKGDTGYDYNIADLYLETKTTVAGCELKPYAHLACNFGADGSKTQAKGTGQDASTDPAEENLGWMLGLDVTRGKWKLGYGYMYVGADSTFGPLRDSDFGETAGMQDTDIQGHVVKLSYAVTKNCEVGATAMLIERINATNSNVSGVADAAELYQFDVSYKF